MCRFKIAMKDAKALRLGLVDDYGKWHLVRTNQAFAVTLGWELHGPRAARGLHFLVLGQTGDRLSVQFDFVGLTRQAFADQLLADLTHLEHLARGLIDAISQPVPWGTDDAPADTALAQQLGCGGLLALGDLSG